MGFDLATAKPVGAAAPAPSPRGFDLATARPIDTPDPRMAGVPGYDAQGRPQQAQPPAQDERPVNGVDVLVGKKNSTAGNLFDKALGVVEAPVTAITGALGGIVGAAAGLGKAAHNKITTGQGTSDADVNKTVENVANSLTYQPRTQTGRKILETVAPAAEALGALPTAEIANLGRAASSSGGAIRNLATANAAAQDVADAATVANGTPGRLRDLVKAPEPAMSGVGAAATPEVTQRVQRAASLPVPVKLTKGQQTRDFSQVAFEKETAKQPEGAPLRNREVEQNQQLLQNFDAFRDQTGAQAPTLRAAGQVVDAALVKKYQAAQAEVNAAYQAARDAGEMAQPVPYKTLSDYLDKHSAEIDTNNVPMLAAVRAKLAKLDPEGTGTIPLNDMEELRKMAGRLTQPDTPNAAHIGDVKNLIDTATENAGGDLYKEARRLNTLKARQFENVGVIDKMMRTKPGTNDRAVALEDVVDHAIFNGSLDDVRQVRRVLQAGGGEEGAQAWRELQGGAIDKLRETMFPAGGAANTAGDTTARYAQFARMVNSLDKDGKLDFVFGKQGAAQLRDFTQTAQDILTTPPGTVNTSNTASALLRAFDKATSVTGSVPGLTSATKFVQKKVGSAVLKKRVDAAVNPPDPSGGKQ
jgi:hypothetical protein